MEPIECRRQIFTFVLNELILKQVFRTAPSGIWGDGATRLEEEGSNLSKSSHALLHATLLDVVIEWLLDLYSRGTRLVCNELKDRCGQM